MKTLKINHIYHGNCLDVLKKLPSNSVDCVVTSPPYFMQRGYDTIPQIWGGDKNCNHSWNLEILKGTSGGTASKKVQIKGQANFQITKDTEYKECSKCGAVLCEIGRSKHIETYVNSLCDIFDECKRVLTPYGTLWVNIGDKNNDSGGAGSQNSKYRREKHTQFGKKVIGESQILPTKVQGIPSGSRMMIPERFAFEMLNRGWALKNDNIWRKLGGMPQSSPMKFTDNYEHVYFFVKPNKPLYYVNRKTNVIQREKPLGIKGKEGLDWFLNDNENKQSYWRSYPYFFKQQFEPLKNPKAKGMKFGGNKSKGYGNDTYSGNEYNAEEMIGANKRAVWHLPTANSKEKHFAEFSQELIRTPIDAGCPEEVCLKCGLPVQPYFVKGETNEEWKKQCGSDSKGEYHGKGKHQKGVQNPSEVKKRMLENSLCSKYEIKARCECGGEFVRKGIVLDPFNGRATTSVEALQQNKEFVGIELNPKYIKMAWKRIKPFYDPKGLW